MKRTYMLKSNNDFKKLLIKRQTINSPSYIIYFFRNTLNQPRFGISISKKRCKLSVNRNKAKRQIKSIISNYVINNKSKNIDVLIVVKDQFFLKEFIENKLELDFQLNKI
ncbi:MAG: ribonuclease P protein component [Malacoplasma sp.]